MSGERQVQQVLARYVRAAETRDGAEMSADFLEDARVEIFQASRHAAWCRCEKGVATSSRVDAAVVERRVSVGAR